MQVRVDSDRSPVGLLGDLASLARSLFSLSSPVTDPITRLSATLEGGYPYVQFLAVHPDWRRMGVASGFSGEILHALFASLKA